MNPFNSFNNTDCFKDLSLIYSSLKKTWFLSKIYNREKIKGLKKFQIQYPEEFQAFLNQKVVKYNGNKWIKPGYFIARYGPQSFFTYIAQFIKEDPVHSDGYTLLHALAPLKNKDVRDPRMIYLIKCGIIKNINSLDNYGRTCLFYLRHYNPVLDCLIRYGVNLSLVDIFGVCAAEYKYLSYAFDFYSNSRILKDSSTLLLKRALKESDPHLASLVINYVDFSNWPVHEQIKAKMLRASDDFYSQAATNYLKDIILPDIFQDGTRLFHFIDNYISNTFGPKSSKRQTFIISGLYNHLLDQYDTRVTCLLKFCNLILQRKQYSTWWDCCIDSAFIDLHIHIPNRLEYTQRFLNLHPIKGDIHWKYILNWLYVSRNDDQKEYHRLLKRAVRLKDVTNNTMLHFISRYDPMLRDKLMSHNDLEWIETCILKMGADIDALNDNKETALFVALKTHTTTWEDTRPLCWLLIKYGAHLDVRNKQNETTELLLKDVLGFSFNSPHPLQCLAARKCIKSSFLPEIINQIIELH